MEETNEEEPNVTQNIVENYNDNDDGEDENDSRWRERVYDNSAMSPDTPQADLGPPILVRRPSYDERSSTTNTTNTSDHSIPIYVDRDQVRQNPIVVHLDDRPSPLNTDPSSDDSTPPPSSNSQPLRSAPLAMMDDTSDSNSDTSDEELPNRYPQPEPDYPYQPRMITDDYLV